MEKNNTSLQNIDNISHKNLSYFATVYANTPYVESIKKTTSELVSLIKNTGMASRVLQIYNKSIEEVNKASSEYTFYYKRHNDDKYYPTNREKILSYLEKQCSFGIGYFIILLQLNTIETNEYVYIAKKKYD